VASPDAIHPDPPNDSGEKGEEEKGNPPGSDEVLLKSEHQPVISVKTSLMWTGKGRKTVDTWGCGSA